MVNIEQVRELKNSGMSYSEVAAQIGVSKQYIAQLFADKEARAELIVKSGGRCERCGKESNRLQAHHTDYNSSPDVVLCVKCHKQIHAGMSDRPALTNAQKQSRRIAELDAIAQAAVWPNWTRYATAVKRGVVSIETNPAASRANPRTERAGGKRGGGTKKQAAGVGRGLLNRAESGSATPEAAMEGAGRMNAFDNDAAWSIFKSLNEAGAGIGNASIPIIAQGVNAAIAAAVAAEREACAKVAESNRHIHGMNGGEIAYSRETAHDIAAAIRARGNGSK